MSAWASWVVISDVVANVEKGTTTAPMRATASIATTHSVPFG